MEGIRTEGKGRKRLEPFVDGISAPCGGDLSAGRGRLVEDAEASVSAGCRDGECAGLIDRAKV